MAELVHKITNKIRDECDNYIGTVQALKALAHELLWDDSKKVVLDGYNAFLGRRMKTSSKNRISSQNTVTPDLVVRRSLSYGVIAEAKISVSSDTSKRERKIIEIQKYDDDLTGWDTPNGEIRKHDLILIVHYFHGKKVQKQIQELKRKRKLSFQRNFALICFQRIDQRQTWMSLELLYGKLSDKEKTEKFANRDKPILLDHIVSNQQLGNVCFYDADPPVPLLMEKIHETVLNLLGKEENLRLREEGEICKVVDAGLLRDIMSERYGPGRIGERTPEIPKLQWIIKGLNAFQKLKWAKKVGNNSFEFIVKNRRKKPFDHFVGLCAKERLKKERGREKELDKLPLAKHGLIFQEPDE